MLVLGRQVKSTFFVDAEGQCLGVISRPREVTRSARWLQDDDGDDEVALHSSVFPSVRPGPC